MDEITEGTWIEWPGSVGKQQGKVGSVAEDVYNVRVKVGENSWMTTVVAKGDRVQKIPPPPGEE